MCGYYNIGLTISLRSQTDFEAVQIYPENGELFVQVEKSKGNDSSDLLVKFSGLGGILKVFYSRNEKKFSNALPPLARDNISKFDRDNCQISLFINLNISKSDTTNLKSLNDYLKDSELLTQAIQSYLDRLKVEKPKEVLELSQDEYEDESEDELGAISDNATLHKPKIKDLWHAILDSETEALPAITASGSIHKLDNGEVFIPYDGEVNPLDQFKKDEIVEAVGWDEYKENTFKFGTVDIARSTLNELYLKPKKSRKSWDSINADTPIYLQSKQNKASYQRRKNALQRILEGESIIKDLVGYFDEASTKPAITYDIQVTDEQFKRYDRKGDHGENIALNKDQRQAFQKLISNGPLSLLQGPPGTGKTEFISAFVHYLFTEQNVKNILLVSQSHEAVNTAAERIRKHSMRLATELQIVRFSNRDVADSEELEDIFSPNLVGQKKQQLNANKINNIKKLGITMGLPPSYLQKRAELQFDIGIQIKRYLKIKSNTKSEDVDNEDKQLFKMFEGHIRTQAHFLGVDNSFSQNIEDILPYLIEKLDDEFNIQPFESRQAGNLINLTQDMLEALSNDRANYDEFLARSRQLVVGTCVGIGQRHIGIAENIYDWVIVDEAARSISSELAIAMQSGKRILLVGDHKQLPPLYSDEHKNALARRLGISKRGEELDEALGSDFERVFHSEYGKKVCATLKTQYRMSPAIGNLVSACFYDGILENGKSEDDIPKMYSNLSSTFQPVVNWLDTTSLPNAYHEVPKSKSSLFNRVEADIIIELLQELSKEESFIESDIVEQSLSKGTQVIGVICMYAEQKKLIRQKFNEKIWEDKFRRLVKIDSVDSYQGKENRIIILSLSRYDKQHSTGFLYLPNRINVALSRAMDRLIIVGATAVWQDKKNSKYPLGKVLTYIQNHDDNASYHVTKLSNKGAKK